MQDFHKLLVWQRALELTMGVHKLTQRFPRRGYPSLKPQLVRAAESIGANIVEGCGAATPKEFARFLDIAIKSASETEYHLLVAKGYGIAPEEPWNALSSETVQLRKMLFALRRRVLEA